MESVFILTAVIGATELIKRAWARDVVAALTIAAAALIGLVAGALGIEGLTLTQGLVLALGAVGIHTTTRQVG